MLRHLVMFKKKPETDEATVAEIMRRLDALQGEIPGLIQIKCHRSIPSDRPVVWTFILDSVIESLEDLPAYRDHPAHVSANEWMTPFLEARAVIDYEY